MMNNPTTKKTIRLGILSLIVFFVVGLFIVTKVNVERGIATAQAEDAKMIAVD